MNQEKIGKFIRQLRNKKNLTQQELAEKLGVTDRAISKWENGRGTPDISLLIPLSKELEITVIELLNGELVEDENNAIIDIIKHKDKNIKIWKYLFLGIVNIILIMMIAITYYGFIIPLKYENSNTHGIIKVLSASMEPTIEVGTTLVYTKSDIKDVKKDDIIIFDWMLDNKTFLKSNDDHVKVIHRVVEITKDKFGNINLTTKGDNNKEFDKIKVTSQNFIGIYSHKTSPLTTFFQKEKTGKKLFVFISQIISIIAIIYLNILQLKK